MVCKHVWDDSVGFGIHCVKCGKKKQRSNQLKKLYDNTPTYNPKTKRFNF